uniref:Secreted protein n=1 Tax=Steinernema glaseri TaxID=37863 RepID=A0A1I7YJZ0_9BILA
MTRLVFLLFAFFALFTSSTGYFMLYESVPMEAIPQAPRAETTNKFSLRCLLSPNLPFFWVRRTQQLTNGRTTHAGVADC